MKIHKKVEIDVSVIIVNYNVRDFLHQSLVSIQKALKGIQSEIIVVDNASDDGSVEMVKRRFPKVKLIVNEENQGFAKANNIALKHARGNFFLLINPDTVVQENTIKVMMAFLKSHQNVGLAGCKVLNPDGSFEPACRRSFPTPWVAFTKLFGLSRLFPKTELFGKYNVTYLSTNETYAVDAVSGSFMMVRRETVKDVGGLDEKFFMYGEDLDWCYRIRKKGWQIYYVHSTQIIHYKGESTRRSNLDEISMFYNAMHLFVEKHISTSALLSMLLRLSIGLVSFLAFLNSILRPLKMAAIDFAAIVVSLLLAEEIRRGAILQYPSYAYPIVFTIPAIIVISSLYFSGVYTIRRMSIYRSVIAVFSAYILISALTAFFKEYAFSRKIIIVSGLFSMIIIPGWRVLFQMLFKTKTYGRSTLFGKRTLIVGTNKDAVELHKKLRVRVSDGYDIIGFIGNTHKYIGKELNGIKILGSVDNVGRIIKEQKISDVIFAPKALSYTQILSLISRCSEYTTGFHFVPTTMEVILGKANVHSLDDVPLVQITYNINKLFHRFTKRMFDILLSTLLLITVYPVFRILYLLKGIGRNSFIDGLPFVFLGKMSLVGIQMIKHRADKNVNGLLYIGKSGLCTLAGIQKISKLPDEDIDQYNIYYARNQNILFDLEILIKSWLFRVKRENRKL